MKRNVKIERDGEKVIAIVTQETDVREDGSQATTVQRMPVTLADAYTNLAGIQKRRQEASQKHEQLMEGLDAEQVLWKDVVAQLEQPTT